MSVNEFVQKSRKALTNIITFVIMKVPLIKTKKGLGKKMANKNNNKSTEVKTPKKSKSNTKKSIIGTMQLFAVASIAYSTVVIAIGTDGIIPLVLVAPQAILGIAIALKKFSN